MQPSRIVSLFWMVAASAAFAQFTPIAPDPSFGQNGFFRTQVLTTQRGSEDVPFTTLHLTADSTLVAIGHVDEVPNARVQQKGWDVIALLDKHGAPVQGFATNGVHIGSLDCSYLGAHAATSLPTGTVYVVTSLYQSTTDCGAGGTTKVRAIEKSGAIADVLTLPYVAWTSLDAGADGSVVLVTQNSGANFYRIGRDSAERPSFIWKDAGFNAVVFLGDWSTATKIAAAANGGWVAAWTGSSGGSGSGYTDMLWLDENLTPIRHQKSAPRGVGEITYSYGRLPGRNYAHPFQPLIDGRVVLQAYSGSAAIVDAIDKEMRRFSLEPFSGYLWKIARNGDIIALNPSEEKFVFARWRLRGGVYEAPERWEWVYGRDPLLWSRIPVVMESSADGNAVYIAFKDDFGVRSSAAIARFVLTETDPPVPAIEFYNTNLKHYFMTASASEAAAIDTGSAGAGWQRTGATIGVFSSANPPASASRVCRFYGTPGKGPNSHFYTFEGDECEAVKKDAGWLFEGLVFRAISPIAGLCPYNARPVWRAYNNGFMRNDSNHRYSVDREALAAMPGWTVEATVFCSPR